MITNEQYFRKPHTPLQEQTVTELLLRVNALVTEWEGQTGEASPVDPDTGSEISGSKYGDGDGGFRSPGSKTGAADSAHRVLFKDTGPRGAAVDKFDPGDKLDVWLDQFEVPMPSGGEGGNTMLEKYGLYREHPSATPGWSHLQSSPPGSGRRTYYP